MQYANFTDPQFVDANGLGGFNAAFGTASGSIASFGSGAYAAQGLIAPEAMTVSFSGLVASIGLPTPWALVTSGGVVVRAHGTQTGQDTSNYSVDFSSFVPVSGSTNVYLQASVTTIQQNPISIPGPPQGHPSYDPNFIPTVGYATTEYTISLAATGAQPTNINRYELLFTTLTPGQTGITSWSTNNAIRAMPRQAQQRLSISSGGALSPSQLQFVVAPSAVGLTHTLPLVSNSAGLTARFFNPTTGAYTVACSGSDVLVGFSSPSGTVSSISVPPSGSFSVWADSLANAWKVMSTSPSMMESLVNTWTKTNTFASGVVAIGVDSGNAYFRAVNGAYGAFLINDTTFASLLQTASGTPFGSFNSFRPFSWRLSDGKVFLDDTGAGVSAGGNISAVGTIAAASKVQAGADATGAVDVPRLSQFANSMTVNGYAEVPMFGATFVVQWFYANVPQNNTPTTFNLPIAFPNACLACWPTYGNNVPPPNGAVGGDPNGSPASVDLTNSAVPGTGFNGCTVLAIGY